jgi:hypothetical protein
MEVKRKIIVRLMAESDDKVGVTPWHETIFSDKFLKRYAESKAFFEEKMTAVMNNELGENNWAITFREFANVEQKIFEALIFGNDITKFDRICRIIEKQIPDIKFHFYYSAPLTENHNQQLIF